jgi:hypothetical protein
MFAVKRLKFVDFSNKILEVMYLPEMRHKPLEGFYIAVVLATIM